MLHGPMTRNMALIFVFPGCALELIAILGNSFTADSEPAVQRRSGSVA